MRTLLVLTILFTSTLIIAQTPKFTGEYGKHTATEKGAVLEYTLSLKPNGTFTFHCYRNIDPTQPKENFYGKGTWEVDKKSVLFTTNEAADINEKFTLNFTGTKARFVKKRLNGEERKMEKTYFLFYDSNLRMVRGLKLAKKQ